MTESEYYAMTKPERDEWVAESLLGWRDFGMLTLGTVIARRPGAKNRTPVPDSDDYNVVMQVIEKMRGNYAVEIVSHDRSFGWTVSLLDAPDSGVVAEALELRDAVYLAAGRAKGVIS